MRSVTSSKGQKGVVRSVCAEAKRTTGLRAEEGCTADLLDLEPKPVGLGRRRARAVTNILVGFLTRSSVAILNEGSQNLRATAGSSSICSREDGGCTPRRGMALETSIDKRSYSSGSG
jgi:hypothetical protein